MALCIFSASCIGKGWNGLCPLPDSLPEGSLWISQVSVLYFPVLLYILFSLLTWYCNFFPHILSLPLFLCDWIWFRYRLWVCEKISRSLEDFWFRHNSGSYSVTTLSSVCCHPFSICSFWDPALWVHRILGKLRNPIFSMAIWAPAYRCILNRNS